MCQRGHQRGCVKREAQQAGRVLSWYRRAARECEGLTRDARKLRRRSAERLREKGQQIVKDCNLIA